MTVKEWAATSSDYAFDSDGDPVPPDPPEGEGWRLVSAVIVQRLRGTTSGPVWYWEREVYSDGGHG